MNLKALLLLLASAVYMLGASWIYNTQNLCGNQTAAITKPTVTPPVIKKERDPLMFNWSSATPLISETKFPGFKANILADNKEGQILEITGKYFDGETAPAGYANMGMARAQAIWKKHFPEIPETRIRLKAEKVTERKGVRKDEFTSAAFNWVTAPTERKVIEMANRALIYFDYNASKKKLNPEVDAYLKKLSERLKSTSEKVIITGHTDSDGDEDKNVILGLRRAKSVRDILIKYGVPRNRITTHSKGEAQPVESNNTDKGKALNRRAVVEIVK